MSAVIYTRPPNRLGKLITAPGGRRLTEAVAAAQANLEGIQETLLAEVDAGLERLRQAATRGATTPAESDARAEVYAQANGLAGLAGLCGLGQLGQVAYNLCELSDRYVTQGVWNAAAIAAHIDTMGVLRHANLPAGSDAGAAVLEGLRALVRQAEAREQEG